MATQFLNCFLLKISKPTFFGHNGQCQCVKSQRKIKRFHLIIHVSNAPALLSMYDLMDNKILDSNNIIGS